GDDISVGPIVNDTMDAAKPQTSAVPAARRESTFLSLAPTHSSPPASPTATKAVPSTAGSGPQATAQIINPVQKAQRSGSDSSTTSESGAFLRLGPVEHNE
ncbi:hypothetical protein LTR53_011530, partial [Teratosphaeriaceae sp. CCFEE 6253]